MPTVTIAGAGALGLASAVALADAGCAVTVCDPAEANASSVAAGMLAPAFEAALDETARPHLRLLLAARDQWPGFAHRTGISLERSGALAVGSAGWLGELSRRFDALGLHAADVPMTALPSLSPGLSTGFDGALLSREDWRLDAGQAMAALRAAAEAAGVAFRREAVRRRDADVLVVATGAARDLAPELASLTPIKGHILRYAAPALGVTVRAEGGYAAPGEGVLAVGATMEPGVGDPAVDPSKTADLEALALRLFPGLEGARPQIAAGVRAASPDGLPLVGRSREDGAVLAVGARRNGWLLAPLIARVVTACVTEGEASPYAGLFDPRRFGGGA